MISVCSPGPAPENPVKAKPKAFKGTVKLQGIEHICRTGRNMPAGRPEPGRNGMAVNMHRKCQQK